MQWCHTLKWAEKPDLYFHTIPCFYTVSFLPVADLLICEPAILLTGVVVNTIVVVVVVVVIPIR